MELCVNTLGGPLCSIHASPHWTGCDVKLAVQKIAGIATYEQDLLCGCERIDDRKPIGPQIHQAGQADVTLICRPAEQAEWMRRVEDCWEALGEAPSEIKSDRDVVRAAVWQSGLALQYASPDLRKDHELASLAVLQDGLALEYVGGDLRSNRDVVMSAVKQNGESLRHAAPELRGDQLIVLAAVRQTPAAFAHASQELRSNRDLFVTMLVSDLSAEVLKFAHETIQNDRDMILLAVRHNWRSILHIPKIFLEDGEVIHTAALQNVEALRFVGVRTGFRVGVPPAMLDKCKGVGCEFGTKVLLPSEIQAALAQCATAQSFLDVNGETSLDDVFSQTARTLVAGRPGQTNRSRSRLELNSLRPRPSTSRRYCSPEFRMHRGHFGENDTFARPYSALPGSSGMGGSVGTCVSRGGGGLFTPQAAPRRFSPESRRTIPGAFERRALVADGMRLVSPGPLVRKETGLEAFARHDSRKS